MLISSDKAVDPSSVMGATKRVAELIVQAHGAHETARASSPCDSATCWAATAASCRDFSSRSRPAGPVTVTHPDMRRYFMLIPEAVQLVLHAAALGGNGALYVLDMGEQIKLSDMARNLIRLSGFVPDKEIPITFIGLRPGEKLSEELVGAEETLGPSDVGKIHHVQGPCPVPYRYLMQQVADLGRLAARGEAEAVMRMLCEVAPTSRLGAQTPSAESSAKTPRAPLTASAAGRSA